MKSPLSERLEKNRLLLDDDYDEEDETEETETEESETEETKPTSKKGKEEKEKASPKKKRITVFDKKEYKDWISKPIAKKYNDE